MEPPGQARGTTCIVLRLASLAQDDPSIFRRNPERVAPVHGRGTSRGVEVVEGDAVDGEDVVFEDVAHEPGEIVVEDEVDGPAEEGQGQPSPFAFTVS